jgi:GNAT superfamily N-acetyltransferase
MSSPNRSPLKCHEISTADQDEQAFTQLRRLCKDIFDPEVANEELAHHSQLEVWTKHIEHEDSKVFYATNTASETPDHPIGFLFVVPRTQPEIGYELLHIWIAAVDPATRGLGVFPLLMEQVVGHARSCGYSEITVCTYPDRFTTMYRILQKNGWELVGWPIEDEKVLMKLAL